MDGMLDMSSPISWFVRARLNKPIGGSSRSALGAPSRGVVPVLEELVAFATRHRTLDGDGDVASTIEQLGRRILEQLSRSRGIGTGSQGGVVADFDDEEAIAAERTLPDVQAEDGVTVIENHGEVVEESPREVASIPGRDRGCSSVTFVWPSLSSFEDSGSDHHDARTTRPGVHWI